MKSIVVYYFSGTGNTKKIVELAKEEFKKNALEVSLVSIEEELNHSGLVDLRAFDLLALAYPIYGFGTPEIVDRFLDKLPLIDGQKMFLLKTGADFISINNNASTLIIRKLESMGYEVFNDRLIVMPSNWIISYNNPMSRQLFESAREKVKDMVLEIIELKRRRYKRFSFLKPLSLFIGYLEKNYGSKYFGKSLRTKNNCNLCQICSQNCPQKNICAAENKITFNAKCMWCMRCIYNCPKGAIYSKSMNFSILKGGYNLEKILNNDEMRDHIFLDKNTKGYYKHFYKYISDVTI